MAKHILSDPAPFPDVMKTGGALTGTGAGLVVRQPESRKAMAIAAMMERIDFPQNEMQDEVRSEAFLEQR
jgi:hypothetical protein